MNFDWLWIALGADAALCAFFYKLWKKNSKAAEVAELLQQVNIGPELDKLVETSTNKTIPYICIEGVTDPLEPPLKSMYKNEEFGVIQKITLVEHRSRRTQGYWTDSKRIIRDVINTIPFQLITTKQNKSAATYQPVQVADALSAEYLMDDLKVTYDKFEPNTSTMIERGVDRFFGDLCRGFQETEKMLNVGVRLRGLGKIEAKDGHLELLPPDGGQRFILTTLTKDKVVKALENRARVMKVFCFIFGAIGTSVLCYYLYNKYQDWKRDREMKKALEEFRRERLEASDDTGDSIASGDTCLICCTAKLEVVLLNCGHICMCASCAHKLPSPKHCPVCRSPVERIQPFYMN